jgi:hypothetical protein
VGFFKAFPPYCIASMNISRKSTKVNRPRPDFDRSAHDLPALSLPCFFLKIC